jgi:hypothetical protein
MNTKTYEFDGMSTEQFNPQDRQNFMEYEFENLLIEKSAFTVELDSKEVKLHLYIQDTDMSEYDNTDEHVIEIGVVPEFESLSEKHQQGILSQFMEDDQEYFKNHTEELLFDIISYGFGITLRSVTVENPDDVEDKINSAIAVRHAVSGLIGFELDRYVNRIGNTGWDFLADYCNDEDPIKKALARYNS